MLVEVFHKDQGLGQKLISFFQMGSLLPPESDEKDKTQPYGDVD